MDCELELAMASHMHEMELTMSHGLANIVSATIAVKNNFQQSLRDLRQDMNKFVHAHQVDTNDEMLEDKLDKKLNKPEEKQDANKKPDKDEQAGEMASVKNHLRELCKIVGKTFFLKTKFHERLCDLRLDAQKLAKHITMPEPDASTSTLAKWLAETCKQMGVHLSDLGPDHDETDDAKPEELDEKPGKKLKLNKKLGEPAVKRARQA